MSDIPEWKQRLKEAVCGFVLSRLKEYSKERSTQRNFVEKCEDLLTSFEISKDLVLPENSLLYFIMRSKGGIVQGLMPYLFALEKIQKVVV